MDKRAFGKTDMQVSMLGFGGAEIGFENVSLSVVKDLLAAALDQGLNTIDTAECYVASEELIGTAVGNRRKDFYLFTKCGHGENLSDAWKKDEIAKTVERSLKRPQDRLFGPRAATQLPRRNAQAGRCDRSLAKSKKRRKDPLYRIQR